MTKLGSGAVRYNLSAGIRGARPTTAGSLVPAARPGATKPSEGTRTIVATLSHAAGNANKVVVAFLDGRRLKGYAFNFSPLRESFRLFPEETSRQEEGKDVLMKDLKAVFFVKTFEGHPEYHESDALDQLKHGRKVEAVFRDGERIVGSTEGYNPQKLGFYVFPADPNSNNLRVFVINKNTHHVKMF